MKFTRLCHSNYSRSKSNQTSQSKTDSEVLLNHAETMWDAEVHNFQRYEARGKLIVGASTGLLGFVSAVAIIAQPGKALSDMSLGFDYFLSLAFFLLGFVCIIWGFNGLIKSARVFVNHSEEDAGSLPSPSHFADNGALWWMTQPTIDSVEEIYLMAIAIRRLSWKTRKGWFWNRLIMRFDRMLAGRRLLRERDKLFLLFRKHPKFMKTCLSRYTDFISYDKSLTDPAESYTYQPKRDRGPRDLASLIVAVYILEMKRTTNRLDAKIVVDLILKDFKNLRSGVECLDLCNSGKDAEKIYTVGNMELIEKCVFHGEAHSRSSRSKELELDILHPPIAVRSSSYYLQLAEAFCWKFCGRSLHPPGDKSPTGSRREFSELDIRSMAFSVFDEVQWKVFTSTYFAAQNLRSVNWNLWFRVKRSEREFIKSFRSMFFAFICVTLGELFANLRIFERLVCNFCNL